MVPVTGVDQQLFILRWVDGCQSIDGDGSLAGVVLQIGVEAATSVQGPGQRNLLLSIRRWRWEACRCGAADRCQSSTSRHLGSGSRYCLSIDGDDWLAGVVLQTGVKAALFGTWATPC